MMPATRFVARTVSRPPNSLKKRMRRIGSVLEGNHIAPRPPALSRSLYSLTGVDNFRVRKASPSSDVQCTDSQSIGTDPGSSSRRQIQPEESLATLKGSVAKSLSTLRNQKLQLADKYLVNRTVERRLGKGRHGIVRPALNRQTGGWVAAKSINKFQSNWYMDDEDLLREVKLLDRLKGHGNILHLIEVFDTPINLHIVTELCNGGDLFSFMAKRDFMPLSNDCIQSIASRFISAVHFCHQRGVIHLDLKLENLMLRNDTHDPANPCAIQLANDFVLIDFGHCQWIDDDSVVHTSTANGIHFGKLPRPMGSPSYGSPEMILNREFSELSDAWSVGVILYVLMQGSLPFPHLQGKHVTSFSDADYLEFNPFEYEEDWEQYPAEAVELLRGLLTFQPEKRVPLSVAVQHPWLIASSEAVETVFKSFPIVSPVQSHTGTVSAAGFAEESNSVQAPVSSIPDQSRLVFPELSTTFSTPMYTSSARRRNKIGVASRPEPTSRAWGS